jgi:hypothetical protein
MVTDPVKEIVPPGPARSGYARWAWYRWTAEAGHRCLHDGLVGAELPAALATGPSGFYVVSLRRERAGMTSPQIERERGRKETGQQLEVLRERWPLAFPVQRQDVRPLADGRRQPDRRDNGLVAFLWLPDVGLHVREQAGRSGGLRCPAGSTRDPLGKSSARKQGRPPSAAGGLSRGA